MSSKLHVLFLLKNKRFHTLQLTGIPRQGDEVRIKNKCYKVTKIVWCLDETTHNGLERVNIQIVEVK